MTATWPVLLISRGAWIEMMRRREYFAVAILMGVFAVGALVARVAGIEKPSVATFMLNLGIAVSAGAAHVMALWYSVRTVPGEIEARTLHAVLARPIARGEFLLGKWLAITSAVVGSWLLLLVLTWAIVPIEESFSVLLALQMIVLQVASIAMIAALGIALSLFVPQAVGLVALGLLWGFGENLANLAKSSLAGSPLGDASQWLAGYLPAFAKLNVITRFTDGVGALSAGEFGGLVIHAALVIAVALSLADFKFSRQRL